MADESNEIGKRLEEFIIAKGLSNNKLGKNLGTSGQQIANMIAGRNFGVDKLTNLVELFPQINLRWLLLGEGPMEFDSTSSVSGLMNQVGGTKNKQKIMQGSEASKNAEPFINVTELQQELKACRDDKDQLSKQLVEVQQELIQVLKKNL